MRKLATIRLIAEIKEIPDADTIEAVRVDGWWCVVKKNEFKINDLCVYFEVDSFLPVRPEFEFLRKSCFRSTMNLGDGFRLKTIRMKKQISQGLIISLSILDEYDIDSLIEYLDVTEIFGVKKWEIPISAQLSGIAKGDFPSFIRKTDQERIQNLYFDLVKTHKDVVFERTLKLDGSSMTVYFNNGQFGVCSRNLELKEREENTYWKVARELNLEEKLRKYGKNIALQGELMGPGIQGNRECLTNHEFLLFDIWNIDDNKYMSERERSLLCEVLKIRQIDLIDYVYPFEKTLEELIEMSDRKSIFNDIAEGIVYKSMDGTTSFKVINNKFLLREK